MSERWVKVTNYILRFSSFRLNHNWIELKIEYAIRWYDVKMTRYRSRMLEACTLYRLKHLPLNSEIQFVLKSFSSWFDSLSIWSIQLWLEKLSFTSFMGIKTYKNKTNKRWDSILRLLIMNNLKEAIDMILKPRESGINI